MKNSLKIALLIVIASCSSMRVTGGVVPAKGNPDASTQYLYAKGFLSSTKAGSDSIESSPAKAATQACKDAGFNGGYTGYQSEYGTKGGFAIGPIVITDTTRGLNVWCKK